jgi:hypothetical protein
MGGLTLRDAEIARLRKARNVRQRWVFSPATMG